MTVHLPKPLEETIREHGASAYNEEACGVLIGKEDRSAGTGAEAVIVRVVELRRMANMKDDERDRRYLIDPREFMRLDRELDDAEWDLVGIYHSHPDHPARPSRFDQDHAMPGLSYLIVSVSEGTAADLTSWRLSDDRKTFHPEPIQIHRGDRYDPST